MWRVVPQLEALQEQVSELRASRDEQDVMNRQREQQQQEKLQGLRQELEALTAEADDAQRRLDGWTDLRNKVLKGIETLFHLVKCDSSPLLELLGERPRDFEWVGFIMVYHSGSQRETRLTAQEATPASRPTTCCCTWR